MRQGGESKSWIFANGSIDPDPVAATNYLLEQSSNIYSHPVFQELFANYAVTNLPVFLHGLRTHGHFRDMIDILHSREILTPEQYVQISTQSTYISLHDLGKEFVFPYNQEKAQKVMEFVPKGIQASSLIDSDPRPKFVLTAHASHTLLGSMSVDYLFNNYDIPSDLAANLKVGLFSHHETDTPIRSMRGIKRSYPRSVFRSSRILDSKVVFLQQLADILDAMTFRRGYVAKNAKILDVQEVKQELALIAPNERIEKNFPNHPLPPAKIREELLDAATLGYGAKVNLAQLPDPRPEKLVWQNKHLVKPHDNRSNFIQKIGDQVWQHKKEIIYKYISNIRAVYAQ